MNNEEEFVLYVSICRPDSELLSNSMKVSGGGTIMKSHCCDADTYNRKVGLFLRNARVSFIMQSTVTYCPWQRKLVDPYEKRFLAFLVGFSELFEQNPIVEAQNNDLGHRQ